VKDHVDHEFNAFNRYKSHTSPEAEDDIANLTKVYQRESLHNHLPGRKIRGNADRAPDFIAKGVKNLTKSVFKWSDGRGKERLDMDEGVMEAE
jgi:hypothetical protein